jgi:multisubunit Na+/H+ antiporter MnhB subunit
MGPQVTASLAAAMLLLTVFFGWRGARKSQVLAAPRMVPWRALMLAAFVGLVFLLIHLANLYRQA